MTYALDATLDRCTNSVPKGDTIPEMWFTEGGQEIFDWVPGSVARDAMHPEKSVPEKKSGRCWQGLS